MAKSKQAALVGGRNASEDPEINRSGMISEQWNEAVRLQAKIRDWIGVPVTLVQALRIARDMIETAGPHVAPSAYRKQIEREATETERARLKEQKRLSDLAGK